MIVRITSAGVEASDCAEIATPASAYFFPEDLPRAGDSIPRFRRSGYDESLIREGVTYVRVGDRTVEVFADYRGWDHIYFLQRREPRELIISDSPFAFAPYRPIDWEVLKLIPVLGIVPAPLSPVEGVDRFWPGERVLFDRATLDLLSRENLLPALLTPPERPYPGGDRELIESTLQTATATRVPSATSPVVFLSGGFDSSLLVHLLQAVGGRPTAWTATYSTHLGRKEGLRASVSARHYGIPWRQVAVGGSEVGEHLHGLLDAMQEPFADVATLAEAILALRVAEEHQTPVVFEGEGMDSLMCGSYKFVAERYRRLLEPMLSLLPDRLLGGESRASRMGSVSLKLRQLQAVLSGGEPFERHVRFNFSERMGLELLPRVRDRVWEVYRHYYDLLPAADTLTRLSCMTLFNVRGNRKLRLIEKYAGVRFELVYQDLDFLRLAFSLPASRKVSRGYGKSIVREAFAGYVPKAVSGRQKLSFTFPVLDYFSDREISDLCESNLADGEMIRQTFEEHKSGRSDHLPFLWGLYVANQWARRYEQAARAPLAGA